MNIPNNSRSSTILSQVPNRETEISPQIAQETQSCFPFSSSIHLPNQARRFMRTLAPSSIMYALNERLIRQAEDFLAENDCLINHTLCPQSLRESYAKVRQAYIDLSSNSGTLFSMITSRKKIIEEIFLFNNEYSRLLSSSEELPDSNHQTFANLLHALEPSVPQAINEQPGVYHVSDANRQEAGLDDIAQAPDAAYRGRSFPKEEPEAIAIDSDEEIPEAELLHGEDEENDPEAPEVIPIPIATYLGNPWNSSIQEVPPSNHNHPDTERSNTTTIAEF